jgi:hypothetical protein
MRKVVILLLTLALFSCAQKDQSNKVIPEKPTENKEKPMETPKPAFDIGSLSKSSEMLDENRYWAIIEASLKNIDNQDDQESLLIAEIEKLTPKEMIGFRLRTDKLLYDTYNSDMWCAAYLMNGGASDDSFEYFRCWLISRGKDAYYEAKANPDSLIDQAIDGAEFYEFESFWYVAIEAFEKKTGEELYDYIDYDKFTTHEGKYPQFEFTWKEEKPETMKKICPKLFAKFWK